MNDKTTDFFDLLVQMLFLLQKFELLLILPVFWFLIVAPLKENSWLQIPQFLDEDYLLYKNK